MILGKFSKVEQKSWYIINSFDMADILKDGV